MARIFDLRQRPVEGVAGAGERDGVARLDGSTGAVFVPQGHALEGLGGAGAEVGDAPEVAPRAGDHGFLNAWPERQVHERARGRATARGPGLAEEVDVGAGAKMGGLALAAQARGGGVAVIFVVEQRRRLQVGGAQRTGRGTTGGRQLEAAGDDDDQAGAAVAVEAEVEARAEGSAIVELWHDYGASGPTPIARTI